MSVPEKTTPPSLFMEKGLGDEVLIDRLKKPHRHIPAGHFITCQTGFFPLFAEIQLR